MQPQGTFALSIGIDQDSNYLYFFSLTATFCAAYLFAIARKYEKYFSQEAIIGIVYAFGSAAVVLLVNHMAHGAEHIKGLLVGQILWVSWFDVIKTALIYSAVGSVHYFFRKQLIDSSFYPSKGDSKWDFLFYILFGIVITSSVHIAGVLQVFAFLIVPALMSTLFFSSIYARLIFGWIFGMALSLLGMGLSFYFDMPSGAFIVISCTSIPIIFLVFSPALKLFLKKS